MDRLVLDAGGAPEAVVGPEVELHLDVAVAVATGEAETGLGLRSAALAFGLDFVPLVSEPFEVATTRPATTNASTASVMNTVWPLCTTMPIHALWYRFDG